MSPDEKICPQCGKVKNDFGKFDWCFGCRAKSISFTYGVGGKEAKDQFHNSTIKELQTETVREAASNGIEAVPAWYKPSSAPSAAGFEKLATALTPKVA